MGLLTLGSQRGQEGHPTMIGKYSIILLSSLGLTYNINCRQALSYHLYCVFLDGQGQVSVCVECGCVTIPLPH